MTPVNKNKQIKKREVTMEGSKEIGRKGGADYLQYFVLDAGCWACNCCYCICCRCCAHSRNKTYVGISKN